MKDNFLDYVKEINLFMQRFCANAQARYDIIKYYDVFVHVYEEYAPGQKVYGWANMGKLIGDAGVTFKVKNKRNGHIMYPVFKPVMAKDMLKHWHWPMPPKLSVFAPAKNTPYTPVDPVNQEMRNLLAYARLFISLQQRYSVPLPYAFEETFHQLHDFPEETIDGAVVVLINRVIRYHLNVEGTFMNCKHLQEFITYLRNKFSMLEFVDSDFTLLRRLLAKEAPNMQCFF